MTPLPSMSAFSTDLERFQTPQCPHRLFWDFGADKTFTTRWSGGRVQVQAPAITPEGYSKRLWKRLWKVLTAKSMAELLSQRSGTAWAGRTDQQNTGCFRSSLRSIFDHSLISE